MCALLSSQGALCSLGLADNGETGREGPSTVCPVGCIVYQHWLTNCCRHCHLAILLFTHFALSPPRGGLPALLSLSMSVPVQHYQCKLPFFASLHCFVSTSSSRFSRGTAAAIFAVAGTAVSSSSLWLVQLEGKVWFSVCNC